MVQPARKEVVTLQIHVKLLGILRDRTPPDNRLEVAEGATLADALASLGIPASHVYLTMVNGDHQTDAQRPLRQDDELTVMPPIAGG